MMTFLIKLQGMLWALLWLLGANALAEPVPPGSLASPYALGNPANGPQDYMRYRPHNDGFAHVDLWRLEARKFVRSTPVLSPNRQQMAYTEVVFLPDTRQTFAKLYRVAIPALPPPRPDGGPHPLAFYQARFDPDRLLRARQSLYAVGSKMTRPFAFNTLTVVDWSASGARLLLRQSNGVLHTGLWTSDVVVYDAQTGITASYPDLKHGIAAYWEQVGVLAPLAPQDWDLIPLGWQPNSDAVVLLKAWAFAGSQRRFLGLWAYDVTAHRTELVSLQDAPTPFAANGWAVESDGETWEKAQAAYLKARKKQSKR